MIQSGFFVIHETKPFSRNVEETRREVLHMVTWLGMKTDKKAERQFFAGVEKKTIFLVLLLSFAILKGVKWGMTALSQLPFSVIRSFRCYQACLAS